MNSLSDILPLLAQDPLRNCNLINFCRSYPVSSIRVEGSSVLIRGRSDQDWIYISSVAPAEFAALTRELEPSDQYFAILEDWMVAQLPGKEKVDWQLSCLKLYLPERTALPDGPFRGLRRLAPADAAYLYQHSHYQSFTSIAYIDERIRNGVGYGIPAGDGALAGWVLTQDDGAIGFLNVLQEYRCQGYGRQLLSAICQRLRQEGQLPFLHIEEDNLPSMKLALGMGFVPDRRIHWLKLKSS
ncbi:ribosomal protein S18 acetylase RimI-like enzyme [Hydrogenispora ethanolica]|jgi:8-oxo-dGTP diphosphatase|uniref:Ribosomal protein S18 acetylase RimI-like enzyme n=1 Tax=Hydrogenispora ethanolica TaxID=1082276 RepID=A0A4R1RH11_HYDET|nr:GNAT family N-acetyltransferase [Hydrogenispora ethanolica]TCL65335.1 ribosomal protein S18 acetylase RimI-like enzyme [Hydrogenispora ethanolica]